MSDARTDADTKPPLPAPVQEDGLVVTNPDERRPEDEAQDAGLADLGGGKPDQRKIV